jgi:capsular exopolysaccharide synthesis family protein
VDPTTTPSPERGELRLAANGKELRAVATSRRGPGDSAAAERHRSTRSDPEALFSPLNVLHALRLRWAWIVLLGGPFAALLAYLAWINVPTPYTAYSELFCQPRRFFWQTSEDDPNFNVYKQTTMRLLKDPMVLTAALRDPKVADLAYVKNSKDVLSDLSDDLRVLSPAEEFIRIELSGLRPVELPVIVNAVTDAFVSEVVVKETQSRRERLDELRGLFRREEEKLGGMQEEMRKIDKALEAPNATQSDSKRQSQLDMQLELRKQLSQLQPQIIELQLLLSNSEPVAEGDTSEGSPVFGEALQGVLLTDREYADLHRQLQHSERMLTEWKRRVNEGHPAIERHAEAVREATERLAQRRTAIEPAALQELRRRTTNPVDAARIGSPEQLSSRLQMLTSLRDKYTEEIDKLQIAERKLAVDWVDREALAEDIETLKETVNTYGAEVLKRAVELDNAPPPIRVHQQARVPTVPETRRRLMMTAASGGAGFLLVLVATLFFEIRAQRISELSMIRRHIHTPVLGVIPQIPLSARRALTRRTHAAAAYWRNVLCEAFDEVRTVLLHNPCCGGARVIIVASSSMSEGKSTSASQLALSLARSGHRVLLLDGDLRRPTLEREFGLSKQPGFCEVLAGSLTLAEAIKTTELPELDLLPAGTLTNEVRSLLARDAHGNLLRSIYQQYHFVIIDTAPVLLTTDTLLLARHVDGAIVVVRKDMTQLHKLEATLHRFEMIGVPVLGLLTLGLTESQSYGYGYGYGYGYAPPPPVERTLELTAQTATTE